MEPLQPEVREALKRAHPDLSDRDIDRFEELSARRFALDPEAQADELARVDAEREELLARRMPRYREVAAVATRRQTQRRPRPAPQVRFKRQH